MKRVNSALIKVVALRIVKKIIKTIQSVVTGELLWNIFQKSWTMLHGILKNPIEGYEMIRCDGHGMKKERRRCSSCQNFKPIEGALKEIVLPEEI